MPTDDPSSGGRGPRPRRRGSGDPATDWLVLGLVGVGVFLLGIYTPSTSWLGLPKLDGTDWLAVVVAIAGGLLAGYGISKWYDERPGGPAERRRAFERRFHGERASDLPSFEVYRPPPGSGPGNKTA